MVPGAVLQRDREDVRDRVVERLARRRRVVLLRVVRAGADHVVRVVRRVDDDRRHVVRVGQVRALAVQAARQVDERLRLVLRRVLLGVRVEDRPLGLAGRGQRHVVRGVGTVEQPGDDAVLALVDRGRRRLAAHRPVHGLDGDLARERRGVGLPRRDLALARLPRGRRRVQRLADRVEDHLGRQAEQRAEAGGDRRAEVGDVVDLVRVQADRADQVDLDLVAGGDAADQRRRPSRPVCCATATIGGMLSPGWE